MCIDTGTNCDDGEEMLKKKVKSKQSAADICMHTLLHFHACNYSGIITHCMSEGY